MRIYFKEKTVSTEIDKVIGTYVKLRDHRDQLREEAKAKEKPVTQKMEKLEAWLMKKANELGVESFKTDLGTAYLTSKVTVSVADKESFVNFIKEEDMFELLTISANKTAVNEYLDENEELPPGINRSVIRTVNVNRPRAKAK
jgi:hypothetical protein